MWLDEEQVIDAIRSGGGIPWNRHHGRIFCGSAAFYRNSYRGSLVQSWLPALDGVVDKLTAGARVADVGCGHGHSTVIMAEAFPSSRFVGFDPHVESIDATWEHARQAGVADRVRFEIADAKSYPETAFDLILEARR